MPEKNDEVRVFFAIELPETIKLFLKQIATDLKKHGGDVRWVNPAGVHLTLKFLGEIRSDLLKAIEDEVRPIFAYQKLSAHRVAKLGVFPDLRKPRVVWVGCSDDSGALVPLVSKLEDSLATLGFPKEKRPFRAHLTLGRVRSSKGISGLTDVIQESADISGPSFVVDHAILFRSILKPSGAEYSPLFRFDFSG
ncbi:MAG: RNA 2',3'-cyclic phosphodiesterase [Desulfomonile tiedjei]|uniref:RNA 2',3'-cyclic phosphodiesterase n=1 Tax=Desulfomonile tiedjei TaxID=2358 RepID=A0A9D6V287_9BACT|nr:RNA 2',3'-cyclic phosphodiesterase [Desulfomonile tiedjei]